jgi:transaldolase
MSDSTQKLHAIGQRLWLDNITRDLLDNGTLDRYIDTLNVTGLTSNPTIFDNAIGGSDAYDDAIREGARHGHSDESIFMELALQDLRRAADLFLPVFLGSEKRDGWVSMEISPLLAKDTDGSIRAAQDVSNKAQRPNLFVKIPGTPESIPAIEEAIYAGIPVNVTLLFSPAQYVEAAEAYMRGIERRVANALDPRVMCVASVFVSRWDAAVHEKVPAALQNKLGIAICAQCQAEHLQIMRSERWLRLIEKGAYPQRLLWASTGTKDPAAPDTLYVDSLITPNSINTLPEKTLLAFADHGDTSQQMPLDNVEAQAVFAEHREAGIDIDALGVALQEQGAEAFVKSWRQLLGRIAQKRESFA